MIYCVLVVIADPNKIENDPNLESVYTKLVPGFIYDKHEIL